MNYLIRGYYGSGNVGDDALVYTLTEEISLQDPTANFSIISNNKVYLENDIELKTSYVRPTNKDIIKGLLNSDVLLFGGGGQFQNTSSKKVSRGLLKQLYLILIAKILFKKVLMYSVSFGPTNSVLDKIILRIIVNLSDKINLRDEKSLSFVKSKKQRKKISISNDISERLPYENKQIRTSYNVVGITVVPINKIKFNNYQKDLLFLDNLVKALIKSEFREGYVFKIIIFHKGDLRGDESYSKLLRTKLIEAGLENELVNYHSNPLVMLEEVSECNYYIGGRLHSIAFANMTNIPFLSLSYHPKFEGFIKYNNKKNPLLIDVYQSNSDEITKKINKLLTTSPEIFTIDPLNDKYMKEFFEVK